MKKVLFTICLSILSLGLVTAQQIDQDKSSVSFEVSNMGFKTVTGTFEGMNGKVFFDQSDLENASFSVCIDATTVNTESKKRDEHLQKEDFFDTENFPNICFESNSIEKREERYIAFGSLSMKGTKKDIEIPFSVSNGVFEGKITLDRMDYNVGQGYGSFMIGKEVEITIKGAVKKENS